MKGLTKSINGKEILKETWLSFLPGAKIGIIGHNGAGKSTIMKIMAGLDKEYEGEAFVADGVKIGYLPQEPQLDPNTKMSPTALVLTTSKVARHHNRIKIVLSSSKLFFL